MKKLSINRKINRETKRETNREIKQTSDSEHRFKLNPNIFFEAFNPMKYLSPITKIILFLLISLTILYFHPTNEIMHCNQDKICNVERTYFGVFKINKAIELLPSSEMSCHIHSTHSTRKSYQHYGAYIKIAGIAPFVFYADDYLCYARSKVQRDYLKTVCSSYKENFQKYINNEEKQEYIIDSLAEPSKLYFRLFIIIMLFLGFFWNDIKK